MHWPQITYLLLNTLCLGITMARHGEKTTVNFFSALFGWLLTSLPLLYFGGFFG